MATARVPKFPGIPEPNRTLDGMHEVLTAVKEAVELLTGQRGDETTTALVGAGTGSGFVGTNTGDFLRVLNNLGDLSDVAAAIGNLGLNALFLQITNNLSDLNNNVMARTNLDVDKRGVSPSSFHTTNYTLVLADRGQTVVLSSSSPLTLTIPTNASVAFDSNTWLNVIQYGTGQVTIVGDTGVVVLSFGGALKLAGRYAMATIWRGAADEWVAGGNLVA